MKINKIILVAALALVGNASAFAQSDSPECVAAASELGVANSQSTAARSAFTASYSFFDTALKLDDGNVNTNFLSRSYSELSKVAKSMFSNRRKMWVSYFKIESLTETDIEAMDEMWQSIYDFQIQVFNSSKKYEHSYLTKANKAISYLRTNLRIIGGTEKYAANLNEFLNAYESYKKAELNLAYKAALKDRACASTQFTSVGNQI